jgi:hypothetical protein
LNNLKWIIVECNTSIIIHLFFNYHLSINQLSIPKQSQLYQFLRKRLFGYGASVASRQNYAQHILSVAKAALEKERSPVAMSDKR